MPMHMHMHMPMPMHAPRVHRACPPPAPKKNVLCCAGLLVALAHARALLARRRTQPLRLRQLLGERRLGALQRDARLGRRRPRGMHGVVTWHVQVCVRGHGITHCMHVLYVLHTAYMPWPRTTTQHCTHARRTRKAGGGLRGAYRGLCGALLPQRAQLHRRTARRLLLTRGQRLGTRRALGGLVGLGFGG